MSASPDKRRPRARSMLSFSGKRSSILFGKGDIVETHEEKEAHEVKTKANPNKAMNEIQPGMKARKTKTPTRGVLLTGFQLPGLSNRQR